MEKHQLITSKNFFFLFYLLCQLWGYMDESIDGHIDVYSFFMIWVIPHNCVSLTCTATINVVLLYTDAPYILLYYGLICLPDSLTGVSCVCVCMRVCVRACVHACMCGWLSTSMWWAWKCITGFLHAHLVVLLCQSVFSMIDALWPG